MPQYLYQGAYTTDSLAAQIRDPKDRLEVVRPAFEAAGGKLLAGGFSFGEYDVTVIFEAPNDTAAASIILAVAAAGAVRAGKTTRLLSGQEWVAALQGAQQVAPQYRPAR